MHPWDGAGDASDTGQFTEVRPQGRVLGFHASQKTRKDNKARSLSSLTIWKCRFPQSMASEAAECFSVPRRSASGGSGVLGRKVFLKTAPEQGYGGCLKAPTSRPDHHVFGGWLPLHLPSLVSKGFEIRSKAREVAREVTLHVIKHEQEKIK